MFKISEESLLVPGANGVRIVSSSQNAIRPELSVKEILNFPMNVYFQVPGGILLNCNEEVFVTHFADGLGFLSTKELIGVTPDKIGKPEYVACIKLHDKQVVENNQMMVFEETIIPLKQEGEIPLLTFKFPCYLDQYEDPVIFGVSISLDTYSSSAISLAEKFSLLLQCGLLTTYTFNDLNRFMHQKKIGDVYFTSQQMKCLKFAIKGMTAKKIAIQLGISFRTVEHHFEHLKHKLKVNSKSELLEKVLDHFIQ